MKPISPCRLSGSTTTLTLPISSPVSRSSTASTVPVSGGRARMPSIHARVCSSVGGSKYSHRIDVLARAHGVQRRVVVRAQRAEPQPLCLDQRITWVA